MKSPSRSRSAVGALALAMLAGTTWSSVLSPGSAIAAPDGSSHSRASVTTAAQQVVATDSAFARRFASPSMADKPKMRWWVPNALMTKTEITREIESMVAAGFGGAEVVSFEKADPAGADVSWGSPRWNELTKHMLRVAGEHDFSIDFTLTPGWPLNLPTITDVDDPAQGAQMEVDGASVSGITAAAPYAGAVPVPTFRDGAGTPTLVAVTVAKYADRATKTLDHASAQSLDLDSVTFPDRADNPTQATVAFTPTEPGEYVLFGWWEYPSGKKAHGNYEIDHYGRTGAQVLIDYWEDNLIPYYGDDWKNVGALFSDSLEFETHLDWTEGLLDGFEAENGYDLAAYLPGLYQATAVGNYQSSPKPDFTFDTLSSQVRNDYYRYLTHLYVENHLKPLNDFAHRHGVELRVQPGYGKNLDMAESAQYVDIPETESLYGDDLIDFYRLQAGAVHLTDKDIYSTETAPEFHIKLNFGGFEYNIVRGNGEEDAGKNQQTWRAMLWHIQRAFSGGVNQTVFHGYSYNGQYDGASATNGFASDVAWPGWESMDYSTNWGDRSPNWKHADTFTSWIARNQQVLREGTAKMDLAIYSLKYWENIDTDNRVKDYDDDGALEQAGYSYDFVAPSGFALDNAQVENKRLDAGGPAYKAIVVDTESTMPAATVDRFTEYAQDGLPIIFVGDAPGAGAYTTDRSISADVERLLDYPSVTQVADTSSVPAALTALDVVPDASYQEPTTLLSFHRQTQEADLYHLYNYGDASTWPEAKVMDDVSTTVTLQGRGRPYLLDAWTGEITPIAEYRKNAGSITLDLEVGRNDSAIIALAPEGFADTTPAPITVPGTDLRVEYDRAGNLIAKSNTPGTVPVTLSNGQTTPVRFGPVPARQALDTWDLQVTKWTKGAMPDKSATSTVDLGSVTELKPWNQIPALQTASGIGTYSTAFDLDAGWAGGVGAVLDLGEVTDSYAITVNGTTIAPNQNDPTIDIGPYLRAGRNDLVLEVATTLFNAWIDEYELAKKPSEYGLMGPVSVQPYRWVALPTRATPPAPTNPVPAKNATATKLIVKPRVVSAGKRARAVLRVKSLAGKTRATGRVRIVIDGKGRGTYRLRDGRVTFRLPKLRVGPHRVRATYLGSTVSKRSHSNPVRIKVVRRR
jgi:hypothetical protein